MTREPSICIQIESANKQFPEFIRVFFFYFFDSCLSHYYYSLDFCHISNRTLFHIHFSDAVHNNAEDLPKEFIIIIHTS